MSENVTNLENIKKETVSFKVTPHTNQHTQTLNMDFTNKGWKINTKQHRRLFTHIQSVYSSVL
jgi:hypothetical protein